MFIKLEQIRTFFILSIHEIWLNSGKSSRLRAYTSQYTTIKGMVDIFRLAVRTSGGRSILKNFLLGRIYWDTRCGSLMFPWTAEVCFDPLGRATLYEKGESDLEHN